jgi:hypothetical protein
MKNLVTYNQGEDLLTFIQNKGAELKKQRVVYVMQPKMAKGDWLKFGTAGLKGGDALTRLKSYIRAYGEPQIGDNCSGVRIHYCGIIKFNKDVTMRNCQAWNIEKMLKQKYRNEGRLLPNRGDEIVSRTPKQVIQDIEDFSKIPCSQYHTPSGELGKRRKRGLRGAQKSSRIKRKLLTELE